MKKAWITWDIAGTMHEYECGADQAEGVAMFAYWLYGNVSVDSKPWTKEEFESVRDKHEEGM